MSQEQYERPSRRPTYGEALHLAERSGATHSSTVASIVRLHDRNEAVDVIDKLMEVRPDWWR